jgi:hypothetical protein
MGADTAKFGGVSYLSNPRALEFTMLPASGLESITSILPTTCPGLPFGILSSLAARQFATHSSRRSPYG